MCGPGFGDTYWVSCAAGRALPVGSVRLGCALPRSTTSHRSSWRRFDSMREGKHPGRTDPTGRRDAYSASRVPQRPGLLQVRCGGASFPSGACENESDAAGAARALSERGHRPEARPSTGQVRDRAPSLRPPPRIANQRTSRQTGRAQSGHRGGMPRSSPGSARRRTPHPALPQRLHATWQAREPSRLTRPGVGAASA
jgi:hypothetical protein